MAMAVISASLTVHKLAATSSFLDEIDHPDTQFLFGCARSHLLGHGKVPAEFEWSLFTRDTRESVNGSKYQDYVSLDHIRPELRALYERFVEMVQKADTEGRVVWRVGNYHSLADKLRQDGYTVSPDHYGGSSHEYEGPYIGG